MPKQVEVIRHSRPRAEADWSCPRSLYYLREFDGIGLNPEVESLEMFFGSSIHDGLAAIASMHPKVDIDAIGEAAFQQVKENLVKNGEGTDEEVDNFSSEQACLAEGLLRGFYKHAWPGLLRRYPKIVAVERDVVFKHNQEGLSDPAGLFEFHAKPDLILSTDDETEVVYNEYKTSSNKKEQWINSWDKSIQAHATLAAINQTLGLDLAGIIVQGLYKGYACLTPETDILTADLRWIPVGMLKVGDKIAGFDEQPQMGLTGKPVRKWAEAEVQCVGRDWLPSYELTLSNGRIVIASANHLWLTTKKGNGTGSAVWTKTCELTTKHNLIQVLEPWFDNTSYDGGYLAGAFDSEGCMVQHKDKLGYDNTWLSFTQNNNVVLKEVTRILEKFGFNSVAYKHINRSTHNINVATRPDVLRLLGSFRPKRLLEKFSFNKLGGIRVQQLVQPTEIKFVGKRQVVTLGTSTETLIAEGLATHNSYGKLSTPLAYAYHRYGNPPFTKTETRYEWSAGFKRYPVWHLEGGVKKWIESMPEEVLMEQFPCTPLIFPDEDLITRFFKQRAIRETEVKAASKLIQDETLAKPIRDYALDHTFPQHFNKCKPAWGFECAFQQLCHGQVNDPVKAGFTYREKRY